MRRLIGSLGDLLSPVRVAFWVLLMLVATVSTQFSQVTASQIAKRNTYAGEVILVRGGFGVFSNGLDKIASSLGRRGITAKVYSHTQTSQIARSIISNQKRYGRKPIILVGHSWGANSVIKIAGLLKRARLRVNYVATIAATDPVAAPSNIQKLTNYYFSKGGWGKPVSPAPGFRGRLSNVDLARDPSINHFNVDENPRMQRQVINNVLRYIRPRRRG